MNWNSFCEFSIWKMPVYMTLINQVVCAQVIGLHPTTNVLSVGVHGVRFQPITESLNLQATKLLAMLCWWMWNEAVTVSESLLFVNQAWRRNRFPVHVSNSTTLRRGSGWLKICLRSPLIFQYQSHYEYELWRFEWFWRQLEWFW